MRPEGWGPKGGARRVGALQVGAPHVGFLRLRPETWGAQILTLFCPLQPQFSFFLPSLGGLLVEFWWCFFGRPGPQMCTFGILGLSCEAPAAPKPPGLHTTSPFEAPFLLPLRSPLASLPLSALTHHHHHHPSKHHHPTAPPTTTTTTTTTLRAPPSPPRLRSPLLPL